MKPDETQTIHGAESESARSLLKDLHGENPVTETIVVQSVVGSTVDNPDFSAYVSTLEQRVKAASGWCARTRR